MPVTLGRLEDGEKLLAADQSTPTEPEEDPKSVRALGLTMEDLSEENRDTYAINADVEGVLITAVEKDTMAEEKGIKPGSVISEVGQESVKTAVDVSKRLDELKKEGRSKVLLLISSKDGEPSFVVLDLS